MSKKENNQTAIKLINKYADSYKALEYENLKLKKEINDIEKTLTINKSIIKSFYEKNLQNDHTENYIDKLKDEINTLNKKIVDLTNENKSIINKNYFENQSKFEVMNQRVHEVERLKNKLFLEENNSKKKETTIKILENEIKNLKSSVPEEKRIEVFISEPSIMLNNIYAELNFYKSQNTILLSKIQELRMNEFQNIENKNELIRQVRILKENLNYVKKYNEKNNFISKINTLNEHKAQSVKYETLDNFKTPNSISNSLSNNEKSVKNSSIFNQPIRKALNFSFENEEWLEILRVIKLTPTELEKFAKNKMLLKLVEAIELLNNAIIEKNKEIQILNKENDLLNKKNTQLNKENLIIENDLNELRKKHRNLKIKYNLVNENSYNDGNFSMNNNTSVGNISITNYQFNSHNKINHLYNSINNNLHNNSDYGNEISSQNCSRASDSVVIDNDEKLHEVNNISRKNIQEKSIVSPICDGNNNYLDSEFISVRIEDPFRKIF